MTAKEALDNIERCTTETVYDIRETFSYREYGEELPAIRNELDSLEASIVYKDKVIEDLKKRNLND